MKFSEIPYVRPDVDKLIAQMEELIQKFTAAGTAQEQSKLFRDFDELLRESDTMFSICYVRNTIDTRDPFYKAEREFSDEQSPRIQEAGQKLSKALLDSLFRAELEKEFGDVLFLNTELEMKSFSPEIIPLIQEESALRSQYQTLTASAQIPFDGKVLNLSQLGPYKQNRDRATRKSAWEADGNFFDEKQAELDEIFDKMVKNRTAQAHKLGMKDYVELGYARQGRNCYTPEDVARFREQVVRDLVPIVTRLKKEQAARIGAEDFRMYDDGLEYPDGNATPKGTPEELLAAGKKMYEELSPETGEFINKMFEMDLFDLVAKPGKANGGYCTQFASYRVPFIFSNFNGTSGDVDVLTHEAGHAFAAYVAEREIGLMALNSPSMEGCETHSMSMEFLTEPWHELFFREQTEKYKLSHLSGALIFIPYGCLVDHFQESVYRNPDMTPAERNAEWKRLDAIYRPWFNAEGIPCYGRGSGWQRQSHIYQSPFYYIEYCLAQSMCLQFWAEAHKDWDAAWKKYLAFVKQGGKKTFVSLVRSAGMLSPLDDGAVKNITTEVEKYLNTLR